MSKGGKPGSRQSMRSREADPASILEASQERAFSELEKRRFPSALRWAKKALRFIEAQNEPFAVANCLQLVAFTLSQLGRYEDAIDSVERARSIFLDLGELHWMADCDAFIAFNLHKEGRSDEAGAKLESARALYLEAGEFTEAALLLAVADLWHRGIDIGIKVTRASELS